MATNISPLGNRILVEPAEQEQRTALGVILPETAKEKPQRGKVLAVGPGTRDKDGKYIPMDVKVGDTVLFAKYAGTEFKVGTTRTLLVMRENDILAVLS